MSISKEKFLLDKLSNMRKWLVGDGLIPKNHPLIQKLEFFLTEQGYPELIGFIIKMASEATEEGTISQENLKIFLDIYKLNMEDFDEEQIDRLLLYIKCFVKILQ